MHRNQQKVDCNAMTCSPPNKTLQISTKGANMYIHLGSDVTVSSEDIIGIFDIERTSVEKSVNEYLSRCQRSGSIYYVSLDMPKSFVVCADCVYVTNVGAGTIRKRADSLTEIG